MLTSTLLTLLPFMLLALAAAAYAHARLARHTVSAGGTRVVRALLLSTGFAFAAVSTLMFARAPLTQAVIAATSFGVVHVPAACILALKSARARHG
ncbi:MAG: hypothetical protein RLW61_16100 [Gammaproteobacteria bacterium]|uniref:hypothetical protein n=1 Tax=Oceanibaculum nanhaiense TaxID=1909734 RepID=UPI0032EEA3E5